MRYRLWDEDELRAAVSLRPLQGLSNWASRWQSAPPPQ
jgi:hypothetical protein